MLAIRGPEPLRLHDKKASTFIQALSQGPQVSSSALPLLHLGHE